MIRFTRFIACSLVAGVFAGSAFAEYPTRPVKWIVPYPPAGTTDVLARIVAQYLSEELGQQFVVENKPGGGTNIGTEFALRSSPDGYTMLLVNPANGINQALYKNLSFSVVTDMQPVAGLVRSPNVMEVTNSFPAKSVPEFIEYCKANPGKINMASSGAGTSVHMSGEMFMMMTGCKMTHIPYKGAGPALQDLIGGQVHVLFDNMPSSIGHIRGGSIRPLAVTTTERSPALPNIPTVADTVKGYEASAWFGIGMPKGSPKEAVDRINAAIQKMFKDPKMVKKLEDLGGVPMPGTPDDFGRTVKAEVDKWSKVVTASGAKVD